MAEKAKEKTEEAKLTREQLIKSGKWNRDVAEAVLKNSEYTVAEANKKIETFLKKEVD